MTPKPTRHNTPETIHAGQWRNKAACLTQDPELFFPDKANREQAARAKAICAMCDVAFECLQYAIESDTNFGIYGGTTEDERRAIRRRALREQRWRSVGRQAVEQP